MQSKYKHQHQHKTKPYHKADYQKGSTPKAETPKEMPITSSWFGSVRAYISNVFWVMLGYKPETLVTPAPCKECNKRAQSQPPPTRRPLMAPQVSGGHRSSSLPPAPAVDADESQSLSYYAEKLRLKRLAKQQQSELPAMPPAPVSDTTSTIEDECGSD